MFRVTAFIFLLLLCGCSPAPKPPAAVLPALFEEVAAQSGVTFRYENGKKGMATMQEENGSGCAVLDYDGDGWLDVYFPNGRDLYGRGEKWRNALYRNNRDGTFADVTEKAGVAGTGYGLGVSVADFDNDGHPDLYVCQWGKNVLYRNRGDGTFEDVTDRAGVGAMDFGEPFHTGSAWFDYDKDGKLDLFVCSYVKFRLDGLRYCKLANGILSNCPPNVYDGTPCLLFHNRGNGKFQNVTKQAKVYLPKSKALSAITCDYNNDGWTDILVGNDGVENYLLKNNQNGTFTNVAAEAGIAFAHDSASIASMGMDTGDFRNEGAMGLFIADWSKRPDHLWQGQAGGYFLEVSAASKVGDIGFPLLGFGAGFFDYDNDGWLDLFIANGHVYPEVEQSTTDESYLQNNQLLRNSGKGTFSETTKEGGAAFQMRHAGRGAAFGDLDNDGDLDIVVSNNDGSPVILKNRNANGNGFVSFQLTAAKGARDAIGSRVFVKTAETRQMREVKSGGSYLSSNDSRLHFGTGKAKNLLNVEVIWASGMKQAFQNVPANAFYALREGDKTLSPQKSLSK